MVMIQYVRPDAAILIKMPDDMMERIKLSSFHDTLFCITPNIDYLCRRISFSRTYCCIMNDKIRIKDIAEKSGVSVGTVERVLHNRQYLSKSARDKVESVLKIIN